MAKESNSGTDKGKVRVRVIDFEMEGNNQTLRESIRDMVTAIGKAGSQSIRTVVPPAGLAAPRRNGTVAAEDLQPLEGDQDDMFPSTDDAADDEGSQEPAEPRQRKPRKMRSLKIVQVELAGDAPLKDFLENAPDALEKRYTLIAWWFKKHRQIEVVTPDHIYTAYMAMGWTTLPKDPAKPFRNAKEDGVFEKAEGDYAFKLTHVGEMKAIEIEKKAKSAE